MTSSLYCHFKGIELDEGIGKNDGNIGGTAYFKAKANHGVLTVPTKCSIVGLGAGGGGGETAPSQRTVPKRALGVRDNQQQDIDIRGARKKIKLDSNVNDTGSSSAAAEDRSAPAPAPESAPDALMELLKKTVVIKGVMPELDKAFLTQVFGMFGTIVNMTITEPTATTTATATATATARRWRRRRRSRPR